MNLKSLFTNALLKKKVVENIILILLLVYLIPTSIFISPSIGIDSSWKISLNLALKEHLNFGNDIAYTFGPLAYLSTGLKEFASSINIVLFWLLSVLSAAFFIRFLLKNSKSYIHLLIVSLILFFQGEILFSRDVIIIFLLFLFFTFYYINYRHKLALIVVSLYAILSFFIKVNTGLIINFLLVIFLVYMIVELPKKWMFYLIFGIVHFCVIIALSIPLHTHGINYIKHSMSIINSYNDAMFLEPHIIPLQLALTSLICLLFCLLIYFKKIISSRYELYVVGSTLLFVFILFKQSFVRADDHFFIFFNLISFMILITYHFTRINSSKTVYFVVVVISFLCTIKVYRYKTPWIQTNFTLSECKEMRKLPESVLNKIGNKSVDLLGSESSYIYYNNLTYNPRPVFQSYAAYNATLAELNNNKYNSKKSPDFVLYHFGSIDNRHPFWDESMLYFNMLDHYKLVDSLPKQYMGGMLLFEKTQIIPNKKTKTSIKKTISLNEEIPIPKSSNILFLTCTINNSFLGSIKRILFQPSTLYVKLKDSENHYYFYKVIAPIMESGVIINKRVHSYKDALLFFKFNGKENKSIQSFKLIGDKKWFDPTIKIQFVEYTSCK